MMRASTLVGMLAIIATMIFWVTGTANAAPNDPDNDDLSSKVEKNVTHAAPRDADTNNERIKDGSENFDSDGVHDANELKLSLPPGDDEDKNHDSERPGDYFLWPLLSLQP
jgi:hypothetical protein